MHKIDLLNPEQQQAVRCTEGPLLVIAGAGSGKTRVVTLRIAHLIERGVPPASILGLTFTNKAAAEMKERVLRLTDSQVLICTFHSLGARILRESIEALGFLRNFTIYDEEDSNKLLQQCIEESGAGNAAEKLKTYKNRISRAKNELKIQEVEGKLTSPFFRDNSIAAVFSLYQKKLMQCNAVDFDDLLYLTVRLFQEHPAILEKYQNRWPYLLIDEYQDTNAAQYTLVGLLVKKTQNICVVGDPDQSIYSWRGADVANILEFEGDYPQAKVIRLEQNYRSCTNILDAANGLIAHNANRLAKNLWSNLGEGDLIKRYQAADEWKEARYVAKQVLHYHLEHGIAYHDMVVFYRANALSRVLEDIFLQERLPYVIVGGISFYQRKEIKDILSYLRVVHSGSDAVALARSINLPKRGIGETTLNKLRQSAAENGFTLYRCCHQISEGQALPVHSVKLTKKQLDGLKGYVRVIEELRQLARELPLSKLVEAVIEKTSYLGHLEEDSETLADRRENLEQLIAKAQEWEERLPARGYENAHTEGQASVQNSVYEAGQTSSQAFSSTQGHVYNQLLAAFLEELALRSSLDEADTDTSRVNFMTLHNSKGLEFEVVFMVALEEGIFPYVSAQDDPADLEEERRLCYVGITRAKKHLHLINAFERTWWGKKRVLASSRFIDEIPRENQAKEGFKKSTPTRKALSQVVPEEQFIDDMDQTKAQDHAVHSTLFSPGDTVFHTEFGIGSIDSIYEGMEGQTYVISFSKDARPRKIVARYASHLTKL